MLTIFRRHKKACQHRHKGRTYRRCNCPIWIEGTLDGVRIPRHSLGLQSLEKAQKRLLQMEATGSRAHELPETVMITFACERFLDDAMARGLAESTMRKYRQLTKQMIDFAEASGKLRLREWNVEATRQFRVSWKDGPRSSLKKLERLRSFFRFAMDAHWVSENPARKVTNPTVRPNPTLPYEREEMTDILAACDIFPDSNGKLGQSNSKRLRAFVLLLRYSGLRIGDASSCAAERLQGDRLLLRMQKTGHPVHVRLPQFVVDALNSIPRSSARYWFWSGTGTIENNAETWRRRLNRLCVLAGVKDAHPHRFRDTFSVELLNVGVPIERVATLLGHESVRVTERSYAPWVKSRQDQLDADLERAWAQDPVALVQTNGTREGHGKSETVN